MRADAIYARQSVDKTDSISTESQVEFCVREAAEHPRIYIDKGYSGKNIDRPRFQALLEDIRQGLIGRVVVYRLDRISRSVLDFSSLISFFREYHVEFVSTMEKFDTGSPIGKAMLMIVMVFAQLERETIQQRVTDAYHSRSEKGFFMGGAVPYGYALSDITLSGTHTKMYTEIPEEIEVVRQMYRLYAQPEISFGEVARVLTGQGVLNRKGKPFTRLAVRDILLNPIYVRADLQVYQFFQSNGAEIVDSKEAFTGWRGAYLYSGNGSKKGDQIGQIQGYKLVLAQHAGAIDGETWLICRKKCQQNRQLSRSASARHTWLAGKVKCARCGYAMSSKLWQCKTKADSRFLVCTHRSDTGMCDMPSMNTAAVEDAVFSALTDKLSHFPARSSRVDGDTRNALTQKQIQLGELDQRINALVARIPAATPSVMAHINQTVTQLEQEKSTLQSQLTQMLQNVSIKQEIPDYLALWEALTLADKVRVTDLVVERIEVDVGRIYIRWRV